MNKKNFSKIVLAILKSEFPEVFTPLNHSSAYQLLVAAILSPQTPDTTTNKVTPKLFKNYSTPKLLSEANIKEIELIIQIVNYHKTKARHLIKMAKILEEKFDGKVPSKLSDLITLPGVGRKVGNVIVSEWFARKNNAEPEGIVIDTHVKRVAFRLGLTKATDPLKVEKDLMKIFPKSEWVDLSLRFIFHGRKTCKSQNPLCNVCPLKKTCPKKGVKTK